MATQIQDTLNQVVQQIQQIQEGHLQINSWGFGDIWEINTSGDINYPLMWLVHEGVDINGSMQNFKFNLIFCDIVKGGEVNENDVLSDQLEIAKDVISQLKHTGYQWDFIGNNIVLDAFTERFTDSVAGYSFSFGLELPFDSNRCSIPTTNINITQGGSASTGGSTAGTIYVYLNGVLQSTTPSSNLNAEIVNILWT